MERLLLTLILLLQSHKIALSRLKSPKVAMFFLQFCLSRLKSPKVAQSYDDLGPQSRPHTVIYSYNYSKAEPSRGIKMGDLP